MKTKDETREYLLELFDSYTGDCDCFKNADGTIHLESWDEDIDAKKIECIINTIINDGYDMTGWRIREIPHPCIFDFYKPDRSGKENKNTKMFSIYYNKEAGEAHPQYCKDTENGYQMFDAKNIAEAVELYEWD